MPIRNEEKWYEAYDTFQNKYALLKHYWNWLHLKKMGFFNKVPLPAIIVDIGCGDGNLLKTLSTKGYNNLYGFDLRIPERSGSNISLTKGSMLDIPYPDHFADVLICFNAMHHLLNDQQYHGFLSQCLRVLKKGGQFFLVEPEKNFFRKLQNGVAKIPIVSDFGPLKEQKIALLEEKEELERFMATDIVALFKNHGFAILRRRSFLKSFILVCSNSL